VSLVLGIASRHLLRGTRVPYTVALLVLGVALGSLGNPAAPRRTPCLSQRTPSFFCYKVPVTTHHVNNVQNTERTMALANLELESAYVSTPHLSRKRYLLSLLVILAIKLQGPT
jgi:hypothetical protein